MKAVAIALLLLTSCMACAGTITYEIVDYTSDAQGRSITKGIKQQTPKDITVVKQEGRGIVLWSKSVHLDKGFSIGFSDSRDKVLKGFGMWVQTKPDRFSWDWFNQSQGQVFEKLRERGSVKVRTSGEPTFQEIAEIEFLTDISLRLIEPGSDGKVTHRVNIKKGSVFSVLP